ncbi:MAG TPA: hypothetical protein VGK24_13385 [Candidatus Angelobacter sp.]|jgi:hypothetical protein
MDSGEAEMKQYAKSLILGFMLLCIHAVSAENNFPQSRLNIIATDLAKGEIGRIEILQMPPEIETRARVTPELLDKWYYYKLTIRNFGESAYRDKIASSFKSLSAERQNDSGDIRWGVIFYTRDEKRVGAVFFDRWGKKGSVDFVPVSFKGSFFSWLEDTFSTCFQ